MMPRSIAGIAIKEKGKGKLSNRLFFIFPSSPLDTTIQILRSISRKKSRYKNSKILSKELSIRTGPIDRHAFLSISLSAGNRASSQSPCSAG